MIDTTHSITFILGTRPEIIKLAPVIRACERRDISYSIIHTGQHYSDELDTVFFEQLELPAPTHNLQIGSGTHGEQTGEMIIGIESILLKENPDVVLVQGDTNSVLAGAIATGKLDIELGHVEAGLRSFDREMPEETNRVLADHTAEYLFAPTDESARLLREEGLPADRIFVTGNTIVDSVEQNRQLSERKSTVLTDLGLEDNSFALMTAHRSENVDDEDRFSSLLEGINRIATQADLEVIYPVHPRSADCIDAFNLTIPPTVKTVPSQDFLDFLQLEANADIVFTDSGGVQEETCILQTPCVTVRDNTERPETVEVGANTLAGVDPEAIVDSAEAMLRRSRDWENPFGDGRAADRILAAL